MKGVKPELGLGIGAIDIKDKSENTGRGGPSTDLSRYQ